MYKQFTFVWRWLSLYICLGVILKPLQQLVCYPRVDILKEMHEGHHSIRNHIIIIFVLPVAVKVIQAVGLFCAYSRKTVAVLICWQRRWKGGVYCNHTEEGIPHAVPLFLKAYICCFGSLWPTTKSQLLNYIRFCYIGTLPLFMDWFVDNVH